MDGTKKLPPLSVEGNRLLRGGEPHAFRGVNRHSLEWGRSNWGGCGGDGHFEGVDFDRIAAWGFDVVRLPLSQANWLGRRCDPREYPLMVDATVEKASARGLYAILDLHWTDVLGEAPCDRPCKSGQQPMPDFDSLIFWRGVAARYADNPGVLFNLYNEPHSVSWECWRNGGCSVSSATLNPETGEQVRYEAIGMQSLYDAVREVAPENVVVVGGLNWAYDLSGVGKGYAIEGTNVLYDTHVYTQWHHRRGDWDRHFGYIAGSHAVCSLEFGSTDGTVGVTRRLLDYFDAPAGDPRAAMSWAIWSWNAPGEVSQPTVLADWNGTPIAEQGTLIYEALEERRARDGRPAIP